MKNCRCFAAYNAEADYECIATKSGTGDSRADHGGSRFPAGRVREQPGRRRHGADRPDRQAPSGHRDVQPGFYFNGSIENGFSPFWHNSQSANNSSW